MLNFVFNVVAYFCGSALLSYFWVYLLALVGFIAAVQLIKYIVRIK